MASQQRRRGQSLIVYRSKVDVDARGNRVSMADTDFPYTVTAAVIPLPSSRAELPGQMDLQIYRVIASSDLPGVDSWSLVQWKGVLWDVVTPPQLHSGERHVRHWAFNIRRRPHG